MCVSDKSLLNGPCFERLYASARSRDFSEQADILTEKDVPWADLVYDFRTVPQRKHPLPTPQNSSGEPVVWKPENGWIADGWSTEIPNFSGCKMPDFINVLRFTDPHGFRFAFIITHDRVNDGPANYARGRFRILLPGFKEMFDDPGNGRKKEISSHNYQIWDPSDVSKPLAKTSHLEAVRDAIKNPEWWYLNQDWANQTFSNPWSSVHADRAMLDWASNGYRSYAEPSAWLDAGMSGLEVKLWKEHNTAVTRDNNDIVFKCGDNLWTDQEIRDWFTVAGGGKKRRDGANTLRKAGLRLDQYHWITLLENSLSGSMEGVAKMVQHFEQAGWTPQGAIQVKKAIANQPFSHRKDNYGPYGEMIEPWTFTTTERAAAYISACLKFEEARHHENSENPPEVETLQMMASMRTESEPNIF